MVGGELFEVRRPVLEVAAEPVRQHDQMRAVAAEVVVERGVVHFRVHRRFGEAGGSGVGAIVSSGAPWNRSHSDGDEPFLPPSGRRG